MACGGCQLVTLSDRYSRGGGNPCEPHMDPHIREDELDNK